MKRASAILIIIILLILGTVAFFHYQSPQHSSREPSPAPSSQHTSESISFPSGGENLVAGQTYTLKWQGGPNPTQIFLINTALESQGTSVSIVNRVYNVPNTGSYTYTIPSAVNEGTYKIQIGTLTSNPFHITRNQKGQAFCQPSDLKATITIQGAAGNIYGGLIIKNISTHSCEIIGNNKLQAVSSAKNITVKYQGPSAPPTFTLASNQTIYSQTHYPNGAQCSSGDPQDGTITFTYKISPTSTITFIDQNGVSAQHIITCVSTQEPTAVTVWNLSSQPISP